MKRVLTLTLALAIVAGGYMFEANGAGEQPSKQAPSISEINIYTPKELNARQKDLVEIGRYTASGDQGALKSTNCFCYRARYVDTARGEYCDSSTLLCCWFEANECSFGYI